MKIALVYTGTTPELEELLQAEVNKYFKGKAEILTYKNPDVLGIAREHGYVTAESAALLVDMFMRAIHDGADAMLNVCSSVGETADACQDLARYTGVPIVRIDEEMCRDAVRKGRRIGIMATLQTTLDPTRNTILRVAREMGKHVETVDCLVDGAFGLNPDEFRTRMADSAAAIADKVDAIVLAQGSMAYVEQFLSDRCHLPVFSSPRYGAYELYKAVKAKGLID